MIPPHGYTLQTEKDPEVIMDVSCPEQLRSVTMEKVGPSRTVFWKDADGSRSRVIDVYDIESEDHLDPAAWFEDDIMPWQWSTRNHRRWGDRVVGRRRDTRV